MISFIMSDLSPLAEQMAKTAQAATSASDKGDKYTPPEGSDKAVYISGLDLSKMTGTYYTTTEETYIETSRFILYLDKGLKVPVNVIDMINHDMDMIEDTTGYSFYVQHFDGEDYSGVEWWLSKYFKTADKLIKIGASHERVEIVAINDKTVGSCAVGGDGVILFPEDIEMASDNAFVMIHELLHAVCSRNGSSMGSTLSEGFATYFTCKILEKDTIINSTFDSYSNYSNYQEVIDEKTIEKLFVESDMGFSPYLLGFRLMHFIIEKYGMESYRKFHKKVTQKKISSGLGEDLPLDTVASLMKSEFSKDFFIDFVRWYKLNLTIFGDKDLSKTKDWSIGEHFLNKYYGSDANVKIPKSVNTIGSEAFAKNKSMKTISIPDSVSVIYDNAFNGCTNLSEVTIPNSVIDISSCAFYNCSNLKKVILSDGIMKIASSTFENCKSLSNITIPEGITTIEENVFCNCTSLKSIKLPSTLTTIDQGAFSNSGIRKIILSDRVNKIGMYLFDGCSKLESVKLPKDMKVLPDCTFWNCKSLKKITLPNKLTKIGDAAFDFSGLTSITIPNSVTTIGDFAFANCNNLKSITIPAGVTSIGPETFYSSKKVTIHGKKGSYAEKYAKKYSIKFSAN